MAASISHTLLRRRSIVIAIIIVIALAIALPLAAYTDAQRYITTQDPVFALRSTSTIAKGTRTEYHGAWYRAMVIRYNDANQYAHWQQGFGDLQNPPVTPRTMIDAINRKIRQQDMKDAQKRTDDEGRVLDCVYSNDDYAGACTTTPAGTGLVTFSRVRILDWSVDGDVLKAYVYSLSNTFFLSADGNHIVLDSGGEATWTASFRYTDSQWTLQNLKLAGDGVSSESIVQSDWPRNVQRMFLQLPHQSGRANSNQTMYHAIVNDARAHFAAQTKDTHIYALNNGGFVDLED